MLSRAVITHDNTPRRAGRQGMGFEPENRGSAVAVKRRGKVDGEMLGEMIALDQRDRRPRRRRLGGGPVEQIRRQRRAVCRSFAQVWFGQFGHGCGVQWFDRCAP